jgi:hypothetical protein
MVNYCGGVRGVNDFSKDVLARQIWDAVMPALQAHTRGK